MVFIISTKHRSVAVCLSFRPLFLIGTEIPTTTTPTPAASVAEVDDTNATVAVSVVVVVAVIIVVALAIMVMFRIRNKSHKIDAINSDVFTTATNIGALHTLSLDTTQPVRRTVPGETYM